MDYYEELGIDRSASEIEIHRAHRRLTKLLHPDQQTDRAMKQLAETQMRRLNAIVEILSNPGQRRQYDRSLNGMRPPSGLSAPPTKAPHAPPPQRFATHSLPWWIGSTIAAVLLTLGVVWFWADNLGSSFGDRSAAYVPPAIRDNGAATGSGATPGPTSLASRRTSALSRLRGALLPAPSAPKADVPAGPEGTSQPKLKYHSPGTSQAGDAGSASHVVVVVPDAPAPAASPDGSSNEHVVPKEPERREAANPSNAPSSAEAVPKKVEVLPPPPSVAANAPARNEVASLPFPALPVAVRPKPSGPAATSKASASVEMAKPADLTPPKKLNSPEVSSKALHQSPLEGEWVYAANQQEKRKPGLYPPEFIDLKLFWNEGALHGQYRARYQITDNRPISPDVSFVLRPADKNARNFVWQSDDGRRGTFKISSIEPSSIRIEWRTTVSSHGPATLTAGMATLVRSSP